MISEQIQARGISNERVIDAMKRVKRHLFVNQKLAQSAYSDHPLPIGFGQTISQPYIVALMTELLQLLGAEKMLEVGGGCGYQTAILAGLCREVYSVERVKELSLQAYETLLKLGCKNVWMRVGDGTEGWVEAAPFDRILVAAAAPEIPVTLFKQLATNGMMIIPVGSRTKQSLIVVKKNESGAMEVSNHGGCLFVPLIGKEGWKSSMSF